MKRFLGSSSILGGTLRASMLFCCLLLSSLFGFLLSSLYGSSIANAASIYDDAYKTTDTLILKNTNVSFDKTVNTDWGQILLNDTWDESSINFVTGGGATVAAPEQISDMRDSFQKAVFEGGYWIVTQEIADAERSYINVAWSEDSSLIAQWYTDGVLANNYDYRIQIQPASNGNIRVCITGSCSGTANTVSTSNGSFLSYIAYLNPNYPVDYEGDELQEVPPSSEMPQYPVGGGFNPTSNFWVNDLDFEIIDTTDQVLIESFKIDMCMFQLPDNTYGDTFTEYVYDCTSPVKVEHTFPELGSYNVIQRMYSSDEDLWYESTLVVKIDGSSYTGSIGDISAGLFENCLKSEFPFVDINACIENVKAVGSLLSFNSIAFGNYDFSNECRNLEVLGFWLHLENKTVCPQVPANIRNIITPFVTFIFGLLGLKFITNRGEGGFN